MPGYNTALQVYYCKQTESPSESHRIAPAPQITISPEIYYANDNPIGYTYNITLNGYANAIRKELDAGSVDYGLNDTITHIGNIRDIFNTNGGNLYIKQGDQNLLVAKGATIKNLQFNESENRWVNYSPFSVELEFNEVDLEGCSENPILPCAGSIFHQTNANNINNKLIDLRNYKIKEFNDKWTFTIDNQIYENYGGLYNNIFRVNYSLSATGKNYYVDGNLVPAWQQARLFVQDKLYDQILSLIGGQLQIEDFTGACIATKNMSQLHDVDKTAPRANGIFEEFRTLRDINSINYDIYNENITCDTSESDGTFSITYNAILKKYDPELSPTENSALHTYTKNLTINSEQRIDASIAIQGNIQGLTRGSIIYYNNDFILPKNGKFITSVDSAETKYSNALSYFKRKVGTNTDLYDKMKDHLNIKKSQLLIKGTDGYPLPTNFTLDHNYLDGTIGYNVTYDKNTAKSIEKGYSNIIITRQDPTEIIQEFIIPGRLQGPIIQKLGMKTSRTVSVNIDGAHPSNIGCEITDICAGIPYFSISEFDQLLTENNSWVKTKEDYTVNKLDGSYSISLEYTVRRCT